MLFWINHVASMLLPVGVLALCVIAAYALIYIGTRIGDLLEACEKAVQGFSGPMRKAAEDLENAAGDIEATTESVKQKAKGSLWDLIRGK